jgi:hypothetical protein
MGLHPTDLGLEFWLCPLQEEEELGHAVFLGAMFMYLGNGNSKTKQNTS